MRVLAALGVHLRQRRNAALGRAVVRLASAAECDVLLLPRRLGVFPPQLTNRPVGDLADYHRSPTTRRDR